MKKVDSSDAILSLSLVAKRLRRQSYYRRFLRPIHQRLLEHPVREEYFNERNIVLDGKLLDVSLGIDFAGRVLDAQTFAHLFSIFDDSDCVSELATSVGVDGAPPGAYISVHNPVVVGAGH